MSFHGALLRERGIVCEPNACYRRATSAAEVLALIIECTSCHARYQYDEERFERKPSKKIKCAKCGSVFEIHNPAFAAKPEASAGDTTFTRRNVSPTTPRGTPVPLV